MLPPDKLLILKIIYSLICISSEEIISCNIFNYGILRTLTSQYLVSTRSKIVAPHMNQVVDITYKLLTNFACDLDDDRFKLLENDESEWESYLVNNPMIQINASKQDFVNWISKFIVNEHW